MKSQNLYCPECTTEIRTGYVRCVLCDAKLHPECQQRHEERGECGKPGGFYYTTAPDSYDGFGTKTVATGWNWQNKSPTLLNLTVKPVRKVAIKPEHFQWQSSRYGSGMHPTWTEVQFQEERRYGYIVDVKEER